MDFIDDDESSAPFLTQRLDGEHRWAPRGRFSPATLK
jgi:hypothetical protein